MFSILSYPITFELRCYRYPQFGKLLNVNIYEVNLINEVIPLELVWFFSIPVFYRLVE